MNTNFYYNMNRQSVGYTAKSALEPDSVEDLYSVSKTASRQPATLLG